MVDIWVYLGSSYTLIHLHIYTQPLLVHWLGCIITMVADVLAAILRQAISNQHGVASQGSYLCALHVIHRVVRQHHGFFPGYSLTQKCGHFDESFTTGCSAMCHFDRFCCHQWWQFHQNDNISVSVLLMGSQSQSNNELCILLLVHSANDIVLRAIWFDLAGQFYVFWFWNGKFVTVTTSLSVVNAIILTTLGFATSTKLATVLNPLFEVVVLHALSY